MAQLANRSLWRIELRNKSTYLCAALIFIAILVFFAATGTAFSGYHFTDDHEMLIIYDYLQNRSLANAIWHFIQNDLHIRFRSFYFVHRVLEIFMFGINFTYLSFYTIALCEITMLTFFFALKKLQFSDVLSILFLCLTFLGPQMAVWWRLGPNETIGMVCLAVCFYISIPKSTEDGIKHFTSNSVVFVIFSLLCSFCKESFVVSIPAICFMRVAFVHKATKYTWKKSLYVCLPAIALLLVAMISELFIIMKLIGFHGYGASYNSLYKTIKRCALLVLRNGYIGVYEKLIIIILCADIISNRSQEKFVSMIKGALPYIIISALIIGPNIFLYSESGLGERYLLPASMGFALSICALLSYIWGRDLFFSVFLTVVLSYLYIPKNLECSLKDGAAFKKEGERTAKFLKTVTDNMGAGDVLYVSHPVRYWEWIGSFKRYMKVINDKPVVYCQLPVDYVITGKDGGIGYMQPRMEEMASDPSVIVGFETSDVEKVIAKYYPNCGYVNINKKGYPVFVKEQRGQ